MNTERPILFSGEMVPRILAGHKTMTRRVIKDDVSAPSAYREDAYFCTEGLQHCCPYGEAGDRLWVRETWGLVPLAEGDDERSAVRYQADGDCSSVARWRPSIHMPRKYSRFTLEVCSVRVERVQEISAKDCMAEGINPGGSPPPAGSWEDLVRIKFKELWDSINETRGYSWQTNPWCWVIEFRRVTP